MGFYVSPRILVFWGFMFMSALWGLSLFMAIAAISRSHAVATAIQVRGLHNGSCWQSRLAAGVVCMPGVAWGVTL